MERWNKVTWNEVTMEGSDRKAMSVFVYERATALEVKNGFHRVDW